jgi:hypothetical protein
LNSVPLFVGKPRMAFIERLPPRGRRAAASRIRPYTVRGRERGMLHAFQRQHRPGAMGVCSARAAAKLWMLAEQNYAQAPVLRGRLGCCCRGRLRRRPGGPSGQGAQQRRQRLLCNRRHEPIASIGSSAPTPACRKPTRTSDGYGNPIITKRKSDDRWVVLVTSGYNNDSPPATARAICTCWMH